MIVIRKIRRDKDYKMVDKKAGGFAARLSTTFSSAKAYLRKMAMLGV